MELPKIHSISKKLLIALLGGFLLVFLLFHMCANLCILRNDNGTWYSDFCHFMGTNYIIKIFEIVLLGVLGLHILLTLILNLSNFKSRPVRYHHASKSKTSKASKYMVITGLLMILCICAHFYDFFAVKLGLQNQVSQYMVKVEDLHAEKALQLTNAAAQYGLSPEEYVNLFKEQSAQMSTTLTPEQQEQLEQELNGIDQCLTMAQFLVKASDRVSEDGVWIKKITYEEKQCLKSCDANIHVEPDFYNMARKLFHIPYICILYLIFFAIVGFHLTHAFQSAFQTFGLNNYKYQRIIEICGIIYTWVICCGFASVPIIVLLFL